MKPRRQSVDFATGIGELLGGILCAGTSGDWTLASATRHVYDGWRVIQERDASKVPTVSYTRGTDLSGSLEGAGGIGGLLARSHGYSSGNWTTHNFYHADGNGNITYLVNSSQTVAASYRYDPFGNTLSSSGSLAGANVYRFSSKEFHATSGLYYYGYRFYDPSVQRWLNRDPIGERGGFNLYALVGNDPPDRIDLLGLAHGNPVPDSVDIKLPPPPPHYDPAYWNYKGAVQYGNNCFSYACNRPTLPGGKPRPKGKPQPTGGCFPDCKSVIDAAKRSGFTDPASDGSCPSGFHAVQAFVDPGAPGVNPDYHWYRQDDTRSWSHKPGWNDATDKDGSGNPITDPSTADRTNGKHNYSQDCGRLCAPN